MISVSECHFNFSSSTYHPKISVFTNLFHNTYWIFVLRVRWSTRRLIPWLGHFDTLFKPPRKQHRTDPLCFWHDRQRWGNFWEMAERIWALPSAQIPAWTELNRPTSVKGVIICKTNKKNKNKTKTSQIVLLIVICRGGN